MGYPYPSFFAYVFFGGPKELDGALGYFKALYGLTNSKVLIHA